MLRSFVWALERYLSSKIIRIPLLLAIVVTLLYLHGGLPHVKLLEGEGVAKELFYNNARLKLLHQAVIEENEGSAFLYRIQFDKGFLPLKFISLKASHCLSDISFENSKGIKIKVDGTDDCVRDGLIRLEIPEALKNSHFHLLFRVKKASQSRTIHLQFFYGWPFVAAFCLLLTLLSLLLFHLLRYEARFIRYILPVGFQFYASNFLSLDIDAWSYDSLGHLDHVKTVLGGNFIPKDICWECFQPPLSYWLSAILYRISWWNSLWSVAAASRLSSVFCFIIFLYFGFKYLQLYIQESYSRASLALIMVFFPTSIIHASRVGNESFFYAAFMAAVYYLTRFSLYKSLNDLKLYSWSAVFALFSKATALVLGPITLLVFMSDAKRLNLKTDKLKYIKALFPLMIFAPVFLMMQRYKANLIQRLGSMNSGLEVKNSFENLYAIDIKDFFSHAFTDTWHDLGGRQYFWNFYLKSMSWGEFDWGNIEFIARLWNIFMLFLAVYMVLASKFYFQKEKLSHNPSLKVPLLTIFICVLSSFSYRLKYPLSPMQDFRFLFPVLFPLGIVFVRFSDAISRRVTYSLLGFASILLTIIWIKVLYL